MKKFIQFVVGVTMLLLIVNVPAVASAIKTWGASENVTATYLNSNFAHIHNTMVGGHGARLVNGDVSASAAIAHSKMATPLLLPKILAHVGNATCSASPCTLLINSGLTSITRSSAGVYLVNLSAARPDTIYAPFVTTHLAPGFCVANISTTSVIQINCYDAAGAAADAAFSFMLFDN
jgi:hypothetical protein